MLSKRPIVRVHDTANTTQITGYATVKFQKDADGGLRCFVLEVIEQIENGKLETRHSSRM
jgi:hypothetical protein